MTRRELIDTLKLHLESGIDEIIEETAVNLTLQKTPKATITAQPANQSTPKPVVALNDAVKQARALADKATTLAELKEAVTNFDGCSLKHTAMNTVFSDGNPNAKVIAIGEAPGANEDEKGIPFCGISGKLLDNIFYSIGLKRSDNLYITNTIFWRPPGNRRPTPTELAICLPFVEKHIALLNPSVLIMVGSTALQALVPDETRTITQARGDFLSYKNQYMEKEIHIYAIFHPSYLLRQPIKKKDMWGDMLKVQEFLGNVSN
jgi:DNA polymerase